ncbi:hypothetical protein A2955_03670 [Candidatus Woesebacteria bacterium RIFCSPLOWO2_01_FULL_37_19]|uniref:Uncharacterized protein n=2 Tax=Candidatus Woeseibacteriota TaxID=1752722 RepID=A0A1F8BB83_9BACT|nr:MAG: hypothetical protein A2771_04285 [Candidatus Woesebacteria bacterium RIFCSPHIGHO2_01_FULL_38_26b]OGM60939.1 MAG: hypothetical protein A2955_03670 [Candidatus Woesebacteria bacterium RIFCSPLOWO2_01_FULL_37_19]
MNLIKKILTFIAEYFVFVVGLLFIFVLGVVYSLLRLEGLLVNLVFLLIAIGWIAFLIKYYWEIMEKKKKGPLIK